MKKLFIVLMISAIVLTGCSVERLNEESIDDIVDSTLKKDSKLKNSSFEGYSYYLPRELYFINKNDYNAIVKDVKNNYYYIYVDVVSYYHNIKKKYTEDSKAYYSKRISKKKKFGYFEINKVKKGYFIEAMYNYTKVESYVKKEDLNDAVLNISMILSSINYNKKVLATIVGENVLNYKKESYNIFETKKDTSNFLNYINEYENIDKEKEKKDEDKMKVENEE